MRHLRCSVPVTMLLWAATLAADDTPIVQPGKPGEPARELTAEQAIDIAVSSYSPYDVRFMQDMIPHHQQAVEMAELVAARTNRPELVDAAGRITLSQRDEIEFMEQWLVDRGEPLPDPSDHAAMHTDHRMAGMATPGQMTELAAATGTEFDRLFLRLMITHHEGAVTMVEELLEQPGTAYDPVLFEFTTDVTNDQTAEIERMHAVLITLSDDPRAGLSAGFDDAGQAILNMKLVASLPRPAGFFDPENPANLPPEQPVDEADEDAGAEGDAGGNGASDHEGGDAGEVGEGVAGVGEDATDDAVVVNGEDAGPDESDPDGDAEDDEDWERGPLLSFSNTDMAFRDDVLVVGSYHGFNIYRVGGETPLPQHLSSVVCPGGQGDVSIVGDLLILSVEETRGRLDCGLEGVTEDVSSDRFRGLRIFDIGDLSRPVQVGAVQTCRGSHTHSVVAADDEKIIVYNSGVSPVREEDELAVASTRRPAITGPRSFASMSSRCRWKTHPRRASYTAPPCSRTRRTARWPASGAVATTARKPRSPLPPTSATTLPCSRTETSPPGPAPATASCSTFPTH